MASKEILQKQQIQALNPDLIREIHILYDQYSAAAFFPYGFCATVSKDLENLGLRKVHGIFFVDTDPLFRGRDHSWVEDRNSTVIDLTASQFNNELENPLPSGVLIIKPNSRLYERYVHFSFPWLRR